MYLISTNIDTIRKGGKGGTCSTVKDLITISIKQ